MRARRSSLARRHRVSRTTLGQGSGPATREPLTASGERRHGGRARGWFRRGSDARAARTSSVSSAGSSSASQQHTTSSPAALGLSSIASPALSSLLHCLITARPAFSSRRTAPHPASLQHGSPKPHARRRAGHERCRPSSSTSGSCCYTPPSSAALARWIPSPTLMGGTRIGTLYAAAAQRQPCARCFPGPAS